MAEVLGRRVLVTGGAGFVGSHIIDALLAEGCAKIVAVDNMVPVSYTHLTLPTIA